MSKLSLSFYTNIPTPNQDDFFEELNRVFIFKAIFYEKTENDRLWQISNKTYKHVYLKDSKLIKWVQHFYKDFHFSWSIVKYSLSERSQFIILSGNYFALNTIIAALILKARGKKVGFFSEKIKEVHGFKRLVKRAILFPFVRLLDFMIFIGVCSKQSYGSLGLNVKHHVIIPYNINNASFKDSNLNTDKLKQLKDEYNSNTHFTLLTSGALIERKGIDLTIKIMEHLNKERVCNIQLLILGDGPLKQSLQEWSKVLPIHFLGFKQKEEIPYYFGIADVFLFCSRYDGWGLVINEAISAGLPCLVNKDVGSSELIENYVNGFICDNQNLLSYVNAIEMLCNDKILVDSIQTNNLQLSEQICSASMAYKLNQFLRENFNNN